MKGMNLTITFSPKYNSNDIENTFVTMPHKPTNTINDNINIVG